MHTELPRWSTAKLRQPYFLFCSPHQNHLLTLSASVCEAWNRLPSPHSLTHSLTYIHTYTQDCFPCRAFFHGGEVRQHVILQHCVEYNRQGLDSLTEWLAEPATRHQRPENKLGHLPGCVTTSKRWHRMYNVWWDNNTSRALSVYSFRYISSRKS